MRIANRYSRKINGEHWDIDSGASHATDSGQVTYCGLRINVETGQWDTYSGGRWGEVICEKCKARGGAR